MGDGAPATSAPLSRPYGVALDASGNLFIADSDNNRIRKVLVGTVALTPTPTPTPSPTPTPVPIPLRTIDPGIAVPQITLTNVTVTDATAVLPTGRTVGAEVAQATNALAGTTDAAVQQDPATGVATLSVAGLRFSFWPLGAAQTGPLGLSRQQATPGLTVDALTGTVTITSAAGIQTEVMAAPLDLRDFLVILAPAGVTGARVYPGQLILTTPDPDLTFSIRPDFVLTPGPPGPGGFAVNPDGTLTIRYARGDRQQIFSLFTDPASVLAAARAVPGVTSAAPNLEGTMTVSAAGQTLRLRPDFRVYASPAGTRRFVLTEPGGPFFDFGDGRRQAFTLVP